MLQPRHLILQLVTVHEFFHLQKRNNASLPYEVLLSHSIGGNFEVKSKFKLKDRKILSMKVKTIKVYKDTLFPLKKKKIKNKLRGRLSMLNKTHWILLSLGYPQNSGYWVLGGNLLPLLHLDGFLKKMALLLASLTGQKGMGFHCTCVSLYEKS